MKHINSYMEDRQRRFLDGLGKVNDNLYKHIVDLLSEYSHGGVLKYSQELAILEDKIKKILVDSGYRDNAVEYLSVTSELEDMNSKYYKKLPGLADKLQSSQRLKVARDVINENLRGAGVTDNVINKVSAKIRTAVVNGATFQETRALIEKMVKEDQLLPRYVHQVTTDALGQYNGAIQADIIENYEPNGFYFVGDLIDTSRPFSIHMETKYGSRMITFDELAVDLAEYCPGGIPSEERITITTPITGTRKNTTKGAGMIEGTTVKTFPIYRAGYETRHSVDLVF